MKTRRNRLFLSHVETAECPKDYELSSLDDLLSLEKNSLDEIFVKEAIGMVSDNKLYSFIENIISKLKPEGILHLQDIDIEQFCLYITNKVLPVSAKNILYTNRINTWHISQITECLSSMPDLQIKQINFVNGYEFYVQTQKKDS